MLYYVRTGSINTTQVANNHKNAALEVIKKYKNLGKFIIVGTDNLDNMSLQDTHMFFSTEVLIGCLNEQHTESHQIAMRLVY